MLVASTRNKLDLVLIAGVEILTSEIGGLDADIDFSERDVTNAFTDAISRQQKGRIRIDNSAYFKGDAWGRKYKIFGYRTQGRTVVLKASSAGPDGVWSTADDLSSEVEVKNPDLPKKDAP
jgi:hypothetical protein